MLGMIRMQQKKVVALSRRHLALARWSKPPGNSIRGGIVFLIQSCENRVVEKCVTSRGETVTR
jgi:hypothetical protein